MLYSITPPHIVLLYVLFVSIQFIINFLIKVATGQISEVDDIREEDVQREKMRKKKHQ